ncbi:MBL fold metallo-hydrolase [Tepidiforma sp.]|uniref:MBL fold metallo-hydrolase n=1 Tax=Tepidiforma sp. TaxID=2682230 RepID=UPI002ADE5FAD|nr:MBL fold metallo-hydrolase [Tepidiforma sp.]
MAVLQLGSVEIQPLLDAPVLMDPHRFMPQHASRILEEFGHQADARGLFTMAVTCYLVRSAGKTILIDTGLGSRRRPGFPVGRLDGALADAGVAPGDIDLVVHTHLHIDHVGWNTVDRQGGAREVFFPRAEFVIQRAEWDYWMQPERMHEPGNEHLVECVEPLRHTGRIRFVEGEDAIDEHLVFVPTPGHTPGHVAIGIVDGPERGIIIGDASHHPMQLLHPDWSPAFDVDPVLSAKTRDALFDRVIAEGRTLLAGHWPFPGIGRLVRRDGVRVFEPLG